jgi:hypothetical protein
MKPIAAMHQNHRVALDAASAGLPVFPARVFRNTGSDKWQKQPLIKGWQQKATTDVAEINRWWQKYPSAVPGIELGRAGLVVIDADRHTGGADGVAALQALVQCARADGKPFPPKGPATLTAGSGYHLYFRQPEGEPLGNRRGALPEGVDVRGAGGWVVAPGSVRPDGAMWEPAADRPLLTEVFLDGVPPLPTWLADIIRAPPERAPPASAPVRAPSSDLRERKYATAALDRIAAELAGVPRGNRNNSANAAAFEMGRMVARSWIDESTVIDALFRACEANGLVADDGASSVRDTILSGLKAGIAKPHDDLAERPRPVKSVAPSDQPDDIRIGDFVAFMPTHTYFFTPTRDTWPAASVNARIKPIQQENGKAIAASTWLDTNAPVEQVTWAPGKPMLIRDRLISEGGWIERAGVTVFNIYRAPTLTPRNAAGAGPWLDHVRYVYPNDVDHIIAWLAHRVQRPHEKINHALVLGGWQGIGKDTLIEPVKRAVGPWNVAEVSPQHLLGRFNGFVKSVILRVSEARDLGDIDRFAFYDHLKAYTVAPPDVLRVDEKNLREYSVPNCCGVIITTNHKTDGIFLPADDRRHYMAWSDRTKDDFTTEYWSRMWAWFDHGGDCHVAAYLAEYDLSQFDPKAPPPKTAAFWDIVDANRASEDAELADVLDRLGEPNATTLFRVQNEATGDFQTWIMDRKNRRQIPHRFEQCGYVPVRNDAAKSGLWVISGKRQVIYAKASMSSRDRLAAACELASVQ